jgi:ATP-binding protein involved in chromosome partitioning
MPQKYPLLPKSLSKPMPRIPNINNIIAIGSGKGGVGKSTTTTQLAFALQRIGLNIGILDCDIYGPSIPILMGLSAHGKPEVDEHLQMKPPIAFDIPIMSIGFLVEPQTPIIWRGPMVTQAVDQLLRKTAWPDTLDILLIDLPPGTGDIHLSICQNIPLTAAVVVTTPQELSLADARRACAMFQKLNIPLLGIIENMAQHQCSACGHIEHLFGQKGGATLATQHQTEILGSLPFSLDLMERCNTGSFDDKNKPLAIDQLFFDCAQALLKQLQKLPNNHSAKLHDIKVSTSS